jgi:peroxiredoxin
LLATALGLAVQNLPGVPAGKPAPPFRARDQFAKEQTLSSLMGPNGLVLLFFRSADW